MARASTKAPRRNFRREPSVRDMESRVEFLKQALVFFNVFFLIGGLAVLAVGIWTLIDKHHYVSLLSATYTMSAYLLVGSGCLVIIASVIGFVGICKLKKSWLVVYMSLLLLIFLLEAAAGVLAYLYADQIKSDLEHRLRNIVENEYGNETAISGSLDSLQSGIHCCGSVLFDDWGRSKWARSPEISQNVLVDYVPVPDSCCKNITAACGRRSHPSNIYYDGCATLFATFLREHLFIIGGVGIGICAVQLFGAILSCCLIAKLKKPKETTTRYEYDYTRGM